MFRRKKREPTASDLLQPGEMVTVRAYAGARADEEPRAIVVGGRDLPVETIEWRAVIEDGARRTRAFVVRTGDARVRLVHDEVTDSWEIERILRAPDEIPGSR